MRDVKGLYGGDVKLNIQDVGAKKVLVIDTYNYGEAEVELGVNEIDELIKNLQEAKEVLSRQPY